MTTSIRRKIDMSADSCKFKGKGVAFTATAGQTTSHNFKFDTARLMESPFVFCKNHAWGDHVTFQIVDGAGLVLDEFATSWYLDDSTQHQPRADIWYSAEMPANFYVRIVYTSVGPVDVTCKVNFFNHEFSA